MNLVALIPARAGSKRCPGKNTRELSGRPLIEWSILPARESGIFSRVILAADFYISREQYPDMILRQIAADNQPDIVWLRQALQLYPRPDAFAILRPTSPFRTVETIQRAYACFLANDCADSIRAVEHVTQTPYKMWRWHGAGMPMTPLLEGESSPGVPYHSSPTQVCPPVYVQNSSLEIAWTRNVEVYGTLHGRKVAPFLTTGYEGFSIDTEADWERAEWLVRSGAVTLPDVSRPVGGLQASATT